LVNRLQAMLVELYGEQTGTATFQRLAAQLERYRAGLAQAAPESVGRRSVTQRDAIMITYGDQVREPAAPPLRTLADFCGRYLDRIVSGVHILPFFPYSSDDGFSVTDYRRVDPALGDWDDVASLGRRFHLMFDAVINHISAKSDWFQAFLRDEPPYRDYFIVVDGAPDLSAVVRPRALPLLTEFDTPSGKKKVWTTFSADQIDLNYHNPEVLLDVIDVLLGYVARGAEFIRLDAIAFLWKEMGTSCLHLPQTHRVVRLLRAILDEVAPHVLLITETNVPHRDNVSYFGSGHDEAQLVYNFALPPLTLHTFYTGDARVLTDWAASLAGSVKLETTFFNFLASHDGIGLNPARTILAEADIDALVERAQRHGGLVSYKNNADGSRSPYELNINYFDALSDSNGGEPPGLQVDRFVAAHAIMLALIGVPGIYFHSLFGSRGWPDGVRQTGRNRTINRQKLDLAGLKRELADPQSLRQQVFSRLSRLLQLRASSSAFDPRGRQSVRQLQAGVFAVLRMSPSSSEEVLCLHSVSPQPQTLSLEAQWQTASDLISSRPLARSIDGTLTLGPYQVAWLKIPSPESPA
jgi:glycosidase